MPIEQCSLRLLGDYLTIMQKCAFYLIRYVPDVFKQEFVNIGVILRVVDDNDHTVAVRFTRNWTRVLCLNPDADTEMFEALEKDLAQFLETTGSSLNEAIERLEDQLSNSLQIEKGVGLTSVKGLLSEDAGSEIDRLMLLYVEPRIEHDFPLSRGEH